MIKWDKFIDKDNFKIAFLRLKFSPKHIHKSQMFDELKAFELYLDENIETVIEILEADNSFLLINRQAFKFYLPKPNNLVRPITCINFIDLLIYQAIANVVAEASYLTINAYANKVIFGNLYNKTAKYEEKKFFFQEWKKNWKNYQENSKSYIDKDGYCYVVDFDIASFYDSINHNLLRDALKNYIDEKTIDLLINILERSSIDFSRHQNLIHSGIPQGPIASAIFAEVFLNKYYDEFMVGMCRKHDIKYLRYADDIRLFAKEKYIGQRFITLLDLLSRDIGLIPQSSKINVNYYMNAHEFIEINANKFSKIQRQFNNTKKLVPKDNKRATTMLNNMLLDLKTFDKTKFSFYIYKVEKDNDLKDNLLNNLEHLLPFIEAVLIYLKKYYFEDVNVFDILKTKILHNDSIFIDYPKYVFFKYWKEKILFEAELFNLLFKNEKKFWLLKKEMLNWLKHHTKNEIILNIQEQEQRNELLQVYILKAKHEVSSDYLVKHDIEEKLIGNHQNFSSQIIGIYLKKMREIVASKFESTQVKYQNPFLDKIENKQDFQFINFHLSKQKEDCFQDCKNFFNKSIFSLPNEYAQISQLYVYVLNALKYNRYKDFFDSMDQFNHILVERLFLIETGAVPTNDYGSKLNCDGFLKESFIHVQTLFSEIHKIRNNELHPKDLKTKVFKTKTEKYAYKTEILDQYYDEWLNALCEIMNKYTS
ncbi:MAG: reverse transcriptase domain-containing protein [Sulfuricurvum sp.]|nr:reverse transcriptase domain-containing protein [Sulfuricurvum sp.]